ncbi:triphosphoribosyl-dephospho-CoA synthase CitG [Bibersteinia trehalosi]|nr:triphosphoribosyl-dephospho-CoA synthase CitG [Bibersteinia trehalosi]
MLSLTFSTTGRPIDLDELLMARETRFAIQQALLSKYRQSVLSVTLTAVGAVKKNALLDFVFAKCLAKLTACFNRLGITPTEQLIRELETGHEALFALPIDAELLKQAMIALEDESPLARLWDLDVISPTGELLSRTKMGLANRPCLVCHGVAKICARERRHSTTEIIAEMQQRAMAENFADQISERVQQALLHEVQLTPKPGLVDSANNGAHHDMDFTTFMASCEALAPFWSAFVHKGMATVNQPVSQILAQIRPLGLQAEQAMLQATNGVNTHKGAIFAFGLVCTALGRLFASQHFQIEHSVEQVCEIVAQICYGVTAELQNYPENAPLTHGVKLFQQYGLTGARGEAEAGFPQVRNTLQMLGEKPNWHIALLYLMQSNPDTNVVHRGGMAGLAFIQQQAAQLLNGLQHLHNQADFIKQLNAFDHQCIQRNLSPGGSADLLALTIFFHFLLTL